MRNGAEEDRNPGVVLPTRSARSSNMVRLIHPLHRRLNDCNLRTAANSGVTASNHLRDAVGQPRPRSAQGGQLYFGLATECRLSLTLRSFLRRSGRRAIRPEETLLPTTLNRLTCGLMRPPRQQAERPPYCSSRSRSAPPRRPRRRSASVIAPASPFAALSARSFGRRLRLPFAQQSDSDRRFHEVRDSPVSVARASASVSRLRLLHDVLPAYARSSALTASSPPRMAWV
jgi:hypothetical protein